MWLRDYRAEARSTADLLNWGALVAPGVVLNKDGSLLAGWHYRGPDLDSATESELLALAEQANRVFAGLGQDWMVHVDAVRRPSPAYPGGGEFPDPVTRLIDEERRREYERVDETGAATAYETEYTLSLTHLPPNELRGWLQRFLVDNGSRGGPDPAGESERHLAAFETQLETIEDQLGATLELERLDDGALLRHLHECLTGLSHPITVPRTPCDLDFVIASQDLVAGFEPRIGTKHLAVIGATGLPLETQPGALDHLNRLAIPFRWSTRWLPLEAEGAQRAIARCRRNWWQKRKGLAAMLRETLVRGEQGREDRTVNQDAVLMADDAQTAAADAASGQVRYGYYTTVLIVAHEDRATLLGWARELQKVLNHLGYPSRLEDINAVEAWRGSLPGHGYPNVRRPLISSRNLADLLPLTSVWPGLKENPSPLFPQGSPPLLTAATSGATPFRLNLHVSDVGHTLVVGPTGTGKSALLGLVMAQFARYPGVQIFAFDKGLSAYALTHAAGGDHYEIGSPESRQLAFQPLGMLDQPGELAWAVEWVETLVSLQSGGAPSPLQRARIDDALRLIATLPQRRRTLTTLATKVQDAALRTALEPYTLEGPHGHLLDAEEDGLREGHWQTFETASLMDHGGQKLVVPVLLYLFHRIQRRLDGRPTLISIDEAWTFLLHELFADRIQLWLKELRKYNALVLFSTQSLADVYNSPKRHVVLESCPTKIFLANPEAASEHGAEIYRAIGLNDRQIELIASAVPKRDYYYCSPLGRRLLTLELGPLALSFVGAGSREDIRAIRELREREGEQWVAAWLSSRGLDDWAREMTPLADPGRRVPCG